MSFYMINIMMFYIFYRDFLKVMYQLQMAHFSKIKRFAIGVSAIGGAVWYFHSNKTTGGPVFASWTTNYTPSTNAKWDFNWDQ